MALNYTTNQQLIDRFRDEREVAALTDSTDPETADATVLTRVLEGAEGYAHGYIARRYKIPVETSDASTESVLREVILDLAEVMLLRRQNKVSEAKEKQYDRAVTWLEGVRDGNIILPSATGLPSTESSKPSVKWGDNDAETASGGSERKFSRSSKGSL